MSTLPRPERRWAVDSGPDWTRFTTFVRLRNAYRIAGSLAHETTPPTRTRVVDTRTGAVLAPEYDPAMEELL